MIERTYANIGVYSLPLRSYVLLRSLTSNRPIPYSHPLQKTAQLWNKSKDELASQLTDLKSCVAQFDEWKQRWNADGSEGS